MAIAGVLVTFAGFLLSVFSVSITSNVTGRLVVVLIGIALSLIGIIGLLNPVYVRNAIWRKDS